jgi:hypothetical protein
VVCLNIVMVKFKIWLVKLNLNIVSFLPVLSRYKIAEHPNCPISVLEKLSNDKNSDVRYYVARHPNCPISILEKLANDEDWLVRSSVAEHPNCPQYLKDYIRMKKFVRTYGKNI